MMKKNTLENYSLLSIGAALLTIVLKLFAFLLTNSVGLLSDALESLVNLVAALVTFFMIRLAQKPPDEDHHYGHGKAEYVSSIAEGLFILLAAILIIVSAINRILHPIVLPQAGLGLFLSVVASLINGTVGVVMLRAGKKHHSLALEADGHHLMTDVWTTVGVLGGLIVVYVTKLYILDPVIAIIAGINIIFTGVSIVQRSFAGFMDSAIDKGYLDGIQSIFRTYISQGLAFHVLRTRQAGSRKFISFHVLVPGVWSVQKAHSVVEEIEMKVRTLVPFATVTTHIEPIEDPNAWNDEGLDRSV